MTESGTGNSTIEKESYDYRILCWTYIFIIQLWFDYVFSHLTRQVSVFNTCIYYLYLLGASKFARPICKFGFLMLLVCSCISRFAYAMCKLYKKSLLVITFGHFHLECILLFLLICNLIFCIGHLALWCSLAYLCVIYQSLHWIYGVYWLACKSFQQSFSVFSRTDYN